MTTINVTFIHKMGNNHISPFGEVLLYLIVGFVFVAGGLVTGFLIRPKRPNEEKLTTYESGEDPIGTAWGQFNVRYYVIALIFLLFDVEIVFLFPWATVFGQQALIEGTQGSWGWIALIEMFLFIGILALGLAYAWVNGYLDWVNPKTQKSEYKSKIPAELYSKINEKYSQKD